VIVGVGVGNLREPSEMRREAAGEKDAGLLREAGRVVLGARLFGLECGVREQNHHGDGDVLG
jgi:hypothetical protein